MKRPTVEPWVIIYGPHGDKIGMPSSWLKGGPTSHDVHAKQVDGNQVERESDWILGPGTHANALECIDYLHGSVNSIYDLVDEGFLDGNKAVLAFRVELLHDGKERV